jgi:hypothetical protein
MIANWQIRADKRISHKYLLGMIGVECQPVQAGSGARSVGWPRQAKKQAIEALKRMTAMLDEDFE